MRRLVRLHDRSHDVEFARKERSPTSSESDPQVSLEASTEIAGLAFSIAEGSEQKLLFYSSHSAMEPLGQEVRDGAQLLTECRHRARGSRPEGVFVVWLFEP